MPNLISGIVLGYIWQLLLNGILAKFGVTLSFDAKYGFWGLVILMNWQLIGYMMIIYIAGLQNVSPDLIEAAKIDGATKTQDVYKRQFLRSGRSRSGCLKWILQYKKNYEPMPSRSYSGGRS